MPYIIVTVRMLAESSATAHQWSSFALDSNEYVSSLQVNQSPHKLNEMKLI